MHACSICLHLKGADILSLYWFTKKIKHLSIGIALSLYFKLKDFLLQMAASFLKSSLFADPATTLNFRSEIMNKCPHHRRKHLLENWTWGSKSFLFFIASKAFKRLTQKKEKIMSQKCCKIIVIVICTSNFNIV